jgi:hypothetical protein
MLTGKLPRAAGPQDFSAREDVLAFRANAAGRRFSSIGGVDVPYFRGAARRSVCIRANA